MPDEVTLSVADGAATVTLNRPESLNSWNEELGERLRDALATCASDERHACAPNSQLGCSGA